LSPLPTRKGLAVLAVCAVAFASGALMSSESFMERLPLYERFRCAICHSVSDPVAGNAPLNDFGTDFHANGDSWDATLAAKDSDGDGFNNGLELGDEDGDGSPDITAERSNPGNPLDKPSSLDEKTWGVIKRLFADPARR